MAVSRDDIWFALRWRRLWAVRPEGYAAMAKYALGVVASMFGGLLLMAAVGSISAGIVAMVSGVGLSLWWFNRVLRRHVNYSVTYDDYFREKNNA